MKKTKIFILSLMCIMILFCVTAFARVNMVNVGTSPQGNNYQVDLDSLEVLEDYLVCTCLVTPMTKESKDKLIYCADSKLAAHSIQKLIYTYDGLEWAIGRIFITDKNLKLIKDMSRKQSENSFMEIKPNGIERYVLNVAIEHLKKQQKGK